MNSQLEKYQIALNARNEDTQQLAHRDIPLSLSNSQNRPCSDHSQGRTALGR